MASGDHGDPGDAPSMPPTRSVADSARPSAAEEAPTIAASTNAGTLASLSTDGGPWASPATYGLLDGTPVLCVSGMAEHGRNLGADPRASIAIVGPGTDPDPLAGSRVTLAHTRVGFGARINSIGELRSATVELVRRAGAVEREARRDQ